MALFLVLPIEMATHETLFSHRGQKGRSRKFPSHCIFKDPNTIAEIPTGSLQIASFTFLSEENSFYLRSQKL